MTLPISVFVSAHRVADLGRWAKLWISILSRGP